MPYAKCFITLCFNKQHKQLPRLAPDYCIEWRVQQASKQVRGGNTGAWRSETGMLITLLFVWGLLVLPCAPFNWACIELQAASSRTSSIFSCHLLHYVYAPMADRSYYPYPHLHPPTAPRGRTRIVSLLTLVAPFLCPMLPHKKAHTVWRVWSATTKTGWTTNGLGSRERETEGTLLPLRAWRGECSY